MHISIYFKRKGKKCNFKQKGQVDVKGQIMAKIRQVYKTKCRDFFLILIEYAKLYITSSCNGCLKLAWLVLGLILATNWMKYLHAMPFLGEKTTYSLLKPLKPHRLRGCSIPNALNLEILRGKNS